MSRLDPVVDDDLIHALSNFKFAKAVRFLRPDHDERVRELVEALGAMLANPGWFDGALGTIIDAALSSIMPQITQVDMPQDAPPPG